MAKPQALGGALHVQVQNSSVVLNGGSEHRTCMSHLSRGRGEAFDGCRVLRVQRSVISPHPAFAPPGTRTAAGPKQ